MILTKIHIDKTAQRKFSQAAFLYEELSPLHQTIGKELIDGVNRLDKPIYILDIGMGTGWLTEKISETFPQSYVVGIDFADGMVEAARQRNKKFSIIQGCAEKLPFQKESFDLIFSNLAYQWVRSLPLAFSCAKNILKSQGKMIFTMFGYQTFDELFMSFNNILSDRENCFFERLPKEEEIKKALNEAHFKNIKMRTEQRQMIFPCMIDLIKWTKNIGANGLQRNFYVGKNLLDRAGEYYNNRFRNHKGVYATFEVIWIEAQK
ncbi:MAG TPA: methyltransferase domain-containing protein [Candidatus Omnitrophota bacterium]|nr:methyltransferase domain-containing protein [Candidatus Omnitrophota bacterium]